MANVTKELSCPSRLIFGNSSVSVSSRLSGITSRVTVISLPILLSSFLPILDVHYFNHRAGGRKALRRVGYPI